jgi:hypothetical protein
MSPGVRTSVVFGSLILASCTSPAPHTETAPSSAPIAVSTASVASQPSTTAAVPSATASSSASAPPVASSPAAPEAPLPNVEVKFYGLHVGGGTNDKAEHAPIIGSVNAHLDDFKKCFAKLEDQKKGGTFGIQLDIPGTGGKAEVSHPRNGLKGDAFKDCMVAAYEAIDFQKPKGGVKTNATYSLIFTPQK